MSPDAIAVVLIAAASIPATLFPLVYGFTSPWWRTPIGRALMVKAVGLALLIDISLVYNFFGDDYAARDAVRLGVFSLITVGVWMQFLALMREKWRVWAARADV